MALLLTNDRNLAISSLLSTARAVMPLEPKGLQYLERWISEDEHRSLIAAIDVQPWLTDISRRVQHHGFRYNYETRKVDPGMFLGPLPDWSLPIADRLHVNGLMQRPDQLIINEYLPGQGIAPILIAFRVLVP
jgi:alkylated DNA repair dioxygenase AlkB